MTQKPFIYMLSGKQWDFLTLFVYWEKLILDFNTSVLQGDYG